MARQPNNSCRSSRGRGRRKLRLGYLSVECHTLLVLIKDCFFRHISGVKEKLSFTVIFEYSGRQNNNREYRLLRNSLWTAVKSSMCGELFWLQTSARYYARKA